MSFSLPPSELPRTLYLLIVSAALVAACVSTPALAERKPRPVYEPSDPDTGSQAERAKAWDAVPVGLHAASGTLDTRYARSEVPALLDGATWRGTGWRGERVNAQIILWSRGALRQLRLEPAALTSSDGSHAIPVRARFERYVLADTVLVADILDDAERLDTAERNTRPVWLSIDIPRDAAPGVYTGRLLARAEGGLETSVPLTLDVQPQRLPAPRDWSFHLDLWQNPYAVARYHHMRPWSPEHFALMKPHLQMLADAGAKCLTTTIIHAPWGGQTYDSYDSMVEWIRRKDGTWKYDYSIFDRYVKFAAGCGFDRYINCYSMVPWTNSIRYLDEASGEYRDASIVPGTPEYDAMWTPFLKDFTAHLKRKRLLGRTVIAMDERPVELMRPAIALLHRYGAGLRLALAGNNEPEVGREIDDWCLIINSSISDAAIRERRDRNALTTFYVCTGPEVPNTFTYSPPAEAVWMGLYASARNMSGFLRWAYDSWTEDPLYDTKHVTWQSGDAFLVYPNARSSVRFERLREGIQLYEKIRILRAEAGSRKLPELAALDDALKGFTYENVNARPAAEDVNRAIRAIDALSAALAANP